MASPLDSLPDMSAFGSGAPVRRPTVAYQAPNDMASTSGLAAFGDLARDVESRSVEADMSLFSGQAASQTSAAFDRARGTLTRDLVARGVQPGSGAWQAAFRDLELDRAANVGAAATEAGIGARDRLTRDRLAVGQLASGRDIALRGQALERYGIDTRADVDYAGLENTRYIAEMGDATTRRGQDVQRYGIDTRASVDRYGIDTRSRDTRYGIDTRSADARYATDVRYDIAELDRDLRKYGIDQELSTRMEIADKGFATELAVAKYAREANRDTAKGNIFGKVFDWITS